LIQQLGQIARDDVSQAAEVAHLSFLQMERIVERHEPTKTAGTSDMNSDSSLSNTDNTGLGWLDDISVRIILQLWDQ
jgi:hypothetical protein